MRLDEDAVIQIPTTEKNRTAQRRLYRFGRGPNRKNENCLDGAGIGRREIDLRLRRP